jgi:hypothetical protein
MTKIAHQEVSISLNGVRDILTREIRFVKGLQMVCGDWAFERQPLELLSVAASADAGQWVVRL